jgi:hypothetical protein
MNTTATSLWMSLYKFMLMAREIDALEEPYTRREYRGDPP